MSLGIDIVTARRRAGWSQRDLAERAGMSQGTVGRAERGLDSRPATIARIAEALGEKVVTFDGQVRLGGVGRSADSVQSDPSVSARTPTVSTAEGRIFLDLPEEALAGLSPARRAVVLTDAKLAALRAALQQQAEQARDASDQGRDRG